VSPERGGRFAAMSVPTELGGLSNEPIAEGNDLAPRFGAGRRNEPIPRRHRHNIINRNSEAAGGKIVVDQRQAADRVAEKRAL
jgi:hypothetical protein